MKKKGRMKRVRLLYFFILLAFVLISCSDDDPRPDKLSGTLKIATMTEYGYYNLAGKILPLHFPNVSFEVVSLEPGALDQMADQIDELKPDIVVFSLPTQYVTLLERGSLLDLNPRIKRDRFKLELMHGRVIRLMKEISGEGLYGLAPVFTSTAIYYNIDLFNKNGVPYPTDRMSWEEMYQLAARFPVEDGESRVYGFHYWGSVSSQLSMLAQAEHMSFYDVPIENLQMNTEPMQRILQTVIDVNKKGSIYTLHSRKIITMIRPKPLFHKVFSCFSACYYAQTLV